jgi:hypothetical protein
LSELRRFTAQQVFRHRVRQRRGRAAVIDGGGQGETPVDVLLRQFMSQDDRFDMFDVPRQRRGRIGIRHWQHTLDLLVQ